jgi:hypothetical protein
MQINPIGQSHSKCCRQGSHKKIYAATLINSLLTVGLVLIIINQFKNVFSEDMLPVDGPPVDEPIKSGGSL